MYEDGKKRDDEPFLPAIPLRFLAVIFDLGMSDINVQKVNQTLPALEGAFEASLTRVAIYTYSGTEVGRMADFGAAGGKRFLDAVRSIN